MYMKSTSFIAMAQVVLGIYLPLSLLVLWSCSCEENNGEHHIVVGLCKYLYTYNTKVLLQLCTSLVYICRGDEFKQLKMPMLVSVGLLHTADGNVIQLLGQVAFSNILRSFNGANASVPRLLDQWAVQKAWLLEFVGMVSLKRYSDRGLAHALCIT